MNILVTGGSSGLGKSMVEKLSNNLENTIYFTFNSHVNEANEIVNSRKNVKSIKCDFTNDSDISSLEKAISGYDLDVLINNAYVGSAQGRHFHKTDPEFFEESFRNNIIPTIRLTQSVIQGFKSKKFGKIINILSAYIVNLPPTGFSVYAANKAYLMQLSKSWNTEYSRYNITSNCISPDFMLTNLSSNLDDRILEQMTAEHPLKRLLTPEEVADSVVFLINSTQQLNGAHIVINAAKNII